MQPENSSGFSSLEQLLAGNVLSYGFPATESLCSSSFYPLDPFEFGEKHEPRNVAASENHKEAERRRRERINGHLDRLRTLLLCNSKVIKLIHCLILFFLFINMLNNCRRIKLHC